MAIKIGEVETLFRYPVASDLHAWALCIRLGGMMTRIDRRHLAALTIAALLTLPPSVRAQDDWQKAYRVGDRVDLHISGPHWQSCIVTENAPESLMRGRCEEYVEPAPGTYRRAGGIYILGRGDVRPHAKQASPAPGGGRGGAVPERPLSHADPEPQGTGQPFRVGDKVQIEASNHWVPCVVAENSPPSVMRVRCEAYPQLSRAAGVYTVDRDNEAAIRRADAGRPGPMAAKTAPQKAAAGGAGLKIGEYACYGSGGRILAGLAFKVLPGNRVTDLDDGNAGTYSVSGDTVAFRGGHMGGQTGRDLRNYNFRIGAQASCEPF